MKILLIGCGNIGKSLLNIWVDTHEIIVIQPSLSNADEFKKYKNIKFESDLKFVNNFIPDAIIVSIKPQNFNNIITELKKFKNSIIISVMAGIRLAKLENELDNKQIVRIMPNISIKTKNSVNLAFTNTKSIMGITNQLFEKSGKVVWLDNEKQIDHLTPIFGSGLAYFFLLAELLVKETINYGISESEARILVQELVKGSANLSSDSNDFLKLRDSITSKGGCTAAALSLLVPNMTDTLHKSLKIALERIEELGK